MDGVGPVLGRPRCNLLGSGTELDRLDIGADLNGLLSVHDLSAHPPTVVEFDLPGSSQFSTQDFLGTNGVGKGAQQHQAASQAARYLSSSAAASMFPQYPAMPHGASNPCQTSNGATGAGAARHAHLQVSGRTLLQRNSFL